MDGKENPINVSQAAVSMNGIELQDRVFFSTIAESREPNRAADQMLGSHRTLPVMEESLLR